MPAGLDRAALHQLYYYMRLTRSLEERLVALHRQGKVVGGLFRSLGQEADAVGSAFALEPGDILSPLIRNLGSMLVKGATPLEVLRQYMAKAQSPTAGRELNIHFNDLARGFLGQISPLGDMVPVMAGIALEFKLRGEPRVGLVYVGDGAMSTGAFHEGMNFAAVQQVPLVVVCENNGWAYSTPFRLQTAVRALKDKAAGYGVPGVQADGNDVLATYEATRRAVDRARAGGGVTLVELVTYRMKGHAEHDNQAYVPAGELAQWAGQDPIARYLKRLHDSGWATPAEVAGLDARIESELDAALAECIDEPFPDAATALTGVYADPPAAEVEWYRGDGAVGRVADGVAPDPASADPLPGASLPDRRFAQSRDPSPAEGEITYLEAIRQGIWEELERDPSVLLLGEDIGRLGGPFRVTEGMLDRFGADRIIDMPVSEIAIVGAAAGMAHLGRRPVCEMQFIDFIACAYDMLTNYVATARYRAGLRTPMVVRGPAGGQVRGGPFHSQNPEAAFLHTPGLKIVCPATARDAKGLIKAAIRDEDPVLYLEHKYLYRRVKETLTAGEEILTPIGQARVARPGTGLSIITYSAMVWTALAAAERLEAEDGLSVEVVDLRTLLPLDDAAIIRTVRKTGRVLVAHEDTRTGGVGGEIVARINDLAFEWLDAPVRRVAAHDVPLPYAPTLEDYVLPQVDDLVAACRWLARY
jgi:pyruvate/2-oxoglutarate/acetoin dehydrogenase E1 component/TPP-dependent pyruvate/acetoin dehydrogenase alpha subunit